jgi:hypothetical protein
MYFITASFKMGDVDAIDPLKKKPLCIEGVYTNVQIMVAKETKESYDAFKGFFDFFAMAGDKTLNRGRFDGFEELDLTATKDMSEQWRGLRKGGA